MNDDITDIPVGTDADLAERLASILGRALNRQAWLLFLDAESRLLPTLMPTELPYLPEDDDAGRIGAIMARLAEASEAAAIVVAYERPGVVSLSEQDRTWLRCLREACLASALTFRGPFLCHSRGVIPVPPDDLVA